MQIFNYLNLTLSAAFCIITTNNNLPRAICFGEILFITTVVVLSTP